MALELHNFVWEGVRLVQVETQAHHISGILGEIWKTLDCSDCQWEDIYSAYYESEQDGTITFYEGESAEAGNPGIWTYVTYDCPTGNEEVVVNPSIDALAPVSRLRQLLEDQKGFKLSLPTTELIPLVADADGVVRVGRTRVTLDTLISAFLDGDTPEEIIQQYSSLNLADVYSVISFYLRHQNEVKAYLQDRQRRAAEVRQENEHRFNPIGIRERLLARRSKSIASLSDYRVRKRKADKPGTHQEGNVLLRDQEA